MGVEGIALEHHGDIAVLRPDVVHHLAADGDGALVHLLEPGDHAQQGRFPAARGTHQDDELAIADGDIDAMEDLEIAEALADAGDVDAGHAALLIGLRIERRRVDEAVEHIGP